MIILDSVAVFKDYKGKWRLLVRYNRFTMRLGHRERLGMDIRWVGVL